MRAIGAAISGSFGALWDWGNNGNGQLGDGTVVAKSSPILVGTRSDWSTISLGQNFSIALKSDRSLWGWGNNSSAQLGDSTVVQKSSPVLIGTLTDWASISAGYRHILATKTDGTAWAWGLAGSGQIGDSQTTATNRSSPVQIGTLSDWASV